MVKREKKKITTVKIKKMKKLRYKIGSIILFGLLLGLMGCNDSFMDRYPETSLNGGAFFQTPSDLELYTNGLYGIIGDPVSDVASDNVLCLNDSYVYQLMRGEITSLNVGGWSSYWTNIRKINYMLDNVSKVKGNAADINNFVGIARFFRAYQYYELVKTYSDVPWYSHALATNDPGLYKTQDPRTLVVDSIMADLQYAVSNVKDGTSKTRVTKWTALALQARIALQEGTTREYHTELGLSDAKRFLQIARDASLAIISGGKFSLYTTDVSGGNRQHAYEALFNSPDLSKNPEMIMFMDYDKTLQHYNTKKTVYNETFGLSDDLMQDYLALDGNGNAVPFQQIAGSSTMSYVDVFKNRDPRLNYTFAQPGFITPGQAKATLPKLEVGGYPQIKSYPLSSDQVQLGGGTGYTDTPIFRLGETYLIYAEARAELGELTQGDLDLTINKLRDRVHMPHATLTDWLGNVDPRLAAHYPNVSGAQKGAILEVRRERRVELACEGLRYQDLMRWKVGSLAAQTPQGIYVGQLGYLDVTGDGKPDIFIGKTQADLNQVTDKTIILYRLDNAIFSLSNGDSGYIMLNAQKGKYTFAEPKYYYKPIYYQDMQVNTNLKQNTYWK